MSSLKMISEEAISSVNKLYKEDFKDEMKNALADMKEYLSTTNLSQEAKLKQYAEFSANLFTQLVSQSGQLSSTIVVQDAQLYEQQKVNAAQIEASEKQVEVAEQERLNSIQKVLLTKEQVDLAKEQVKEIKTKTYLAIMETKAKTDMTVAQTISEARRNGADITSTERTWIDPSTNQTISYQHLSLVAAAATDTTKGLLGLQMNLADKQSNTFRDHTMLQYGNQIQQMISNGMADGMTTGLSGLVKAHKLIGTTMIPTLTLGSDYGITD